MTPHDEVIAWIDREVIEAGWSADSPVDSDLLHHQSDIDGARKYRASLLANRAGLERQRKNNTSLEHSTMSELKYEDGYNACLAELQTEIYDLIRSVM